ncbi:ABC transporter substrate-binding protein [Brevibacillus fulvus]|uniref:Iron complex transport system substrate-binding protein n=1 Tax=Brevibacillus fulvus TaxID=1125967 RepID=A0A939BRQ6_9BACL|nr:ABC transporter substrate-binding protein [Brevibacillus fulvus]MBM7589698.1 iron complex transport system substrate-binding protein [Brevibacillus fulvus]
MLHKQTQMIASIFSLLMLLVLTACGQQAGSTAPAAGSETRTVQTAKGEVTVPVHPKRIVTDLYLADVLALGIKPVGANEWSLRNPYIKEQIEGIEDIGAPISVEKVLALKPDLIILQSDENYEKLSMIAPTVVIPYASEGDFYGELRKIADVIGQQEKTEEWIASFEQKAAEARKQIEPLVAEGETFGLYELADGKVWMFGDNWGRGGQVLYKALQLSPPPIMRELISQGTQYKELAIESLPEYAADNMFVTTYSAASKGSAPDSFADLQTNPVWNSLDAVKQKRVFLMDFAMYYADPYALESQLQLMVQKITESHQH